MNFPKIDNQGQARIFSNSYLEALTRTRPIVIYLIYIPLSAYMLYYSFTGLNFSLVSIILLFMSGIFVWTLFEYLAHRYLFHYEAQSRLGQRIVYIFHGNHHEYPRDKTRLFMPPVPSIIFASVVFMLIFCLFYLLGGAANYAFVFFPGFLTGYLLYVTIHYAIHAFRPPKPFRALWRYHNLHHYKYPEKAFGVSSSFWDLVFGTLPDDKNKEQKDSTH